MTKPFARGVDGFAWRGTSRLSPAENRPPAIFLLRIAARIAIEPPLYSARAWRNW